MHETKQAAARERGSLLVPLGLAHFDEAYRILSDSFPADEIRPYEMQKALLEDPAYRFYGVLDRDSGAVKALLAVYDLDAVIFVEHFAVSADCRNQGLGAKMLRQLLDSCGKMVCLEVEHPTTDMAKRRMALYQRNGFFVNGYPYVQPPLAPGQNSVPLVLMTAGKPVNPAEFRQIQALLYSRVYHCSAL